MIEKVQIFQGNDKKWYWRLMEGVRVLALSRPLTKATAKSQSKRVAKQLKVLVWEIQVSPDFLFETGVNTEPKVSTVPSRPDDLLPADTVRVEHHAS